MAPLRQRQVLSKERFPGYFGSLKTQSYHDSSSRGASVHSVRTLDWNPLGSFIATGTSDRIVRVWNPDRPNVRQSTELKGHAAGIEVVAFNPTKDAELCSVSSDGVLKYWDVRTKGCVGEVKGLGEVLSCVWRPDGSSIVVGNKSDNLHILEPGQPSPIAAVQQDVQTNQIAFDWTGQAIFLTSGTGQVKILSYPDFEPLLHQPWDEKEAFELNGHASSCLSATLSPNGRYLATGGSDSIIALWDTTDWICQRTLADMTGPVRSISFTFDGSYIVGGSDEGTGLEICHTETGERIHSVKTTLPSPVVAWHPSRYHLAYTDVGGLKIVGLEGDRK